MAAFRDQSAHHRSDIIVRTSQIKGFAVTGPQRDLFAAVGGRVQTPQGLQGIPNALIKLEPKLARVRYGFPDDLHREGIFRMDHRVPVHHHRAEFALILVPCPELCDEALLGSEASQVHKEHTADDPAERGLFRDQYLGQITRVMPPFRDQAFEDRPWSSRPEFEIAFVRRARRTAFLVLSLRLA